MARNATVLGILMILAALSQAGIALFDGDAATTVSVDTLSAAIIGGLALIFGEKFSLAGITGQAKAGTVTPRPRAGE